MFASGYKYKHSKNKRSDVLAVHTHQKKQTLLLNLRPAVRGAPGLRSIITIMKYTLIDYKVIDKFQQG